MGQANTEPDVMARAHAADPDAWRELYERIGGRLVVWLRTHPHLDASMAPEDIASEAWFTAASRIADFTGDDDAFAGWVFGIARHHLLNTNRRAIRRATTPTDADPRRLPGIRGSYVQDGQDGLAHTDQLDWIHGLLLQLPTREAEVVACLDVVGLDVAATAAALGISSNGVRVSHHRALRRLRHILAGPSTAPSAAPPLTRPVRPTAH